jgi:hypothetical protein
MGSATLLQRVPRSNRHAQLRATPAGGASWPASPSASSVHCSVRDLQAALFHFMQARTMCRRQLWMHLCPRLCTCHRLELTPFMLRCEAIAGEGPRGRRLPRSARLLLLEPLVAVCAGSIRCTASARTGATTAWLLHSSAAGAHLSSSSAARGALGGHPLVGVDGRGHPGGQRHEAGELATVGAQRMGRGSIES